MRKTKYYSIFSLICIISMIFSFFNTGINITTITNENFTHNHQDMQASASPLNKDHQILPLSILVYTEYADATRELPHTMQAIDNNYGTDYYYENLTDYTKLESKLPGHDILLIPEQEQVPNQNIMKAIGTSWSSTLINFVNDGGIIIQLDFYAGGYGGGQYIYNQSGLMSINGYFRLHTSISSVNIANNNDALARGISGSPWTDQSGTISVDTSDGVVVVEDNNNDPVVIHKIMGRGHIVYCGFDLFDSHSNYETLLGNAIRLHRHVIFDESHNPLGTISEEFSSLVDDLLNENFAVSNMTSFDPLYLNSGEVLIITRPTAVYSTSQIDAIETFAKNGGGIFIASEFSVYGTLLDPITECFGFGRNKTNHLIDDEFEGNSALIKYDNTLNHSVTLNIGSVQFFVGSGFTTLPSSAIPLISTDTDGTSTWDSGYPANGVPVVASVITEGNGRVIVCGDNSFMHDDYNYDSDATNDYFDEDNREFLLNTICWLSAAGVEESIILFEESHHPVLDINDDEYRIFGNYLTSNGYTLKWMTTFYPHLIDSDDILFVCDGTDPYNTNEIGNITNFVSGGGGLFLLGDHGISSEEIDPIAHIFNIDLINTGYLEDDDNHYDIYTSYVIYENTNINPHQITQGVSRIEVSRSTAFTTNSIGTRLIMTDTDGTSHWNDDSPANGLAIMISTQYSLGRVIIYTDRNIMASDSDIDGDGDCLFFDSDNEKLVINSFQWLSEEIIPSIGGGSGGGGSGGNGNKKEEAIPGYNLYILIGILGVVLITSIKKKAKQMIYNKN